MPIKFFQSAQNGAPVLNGQAGSLITLLDAVLVNGYGQVNIDSITRSGGTVTVTTSAQHKFTGWPKSDVALIAGADQADYNGEFEINVVSDTVFTYSISTTPTTPATTSGTMTVKRAPAGFDKVFSGTNKAVYRAKTGGRRYFRVTDDATTAGAAKEGTIRGYLSMSDVDTGTEPFPTVAQAALGCYIYKSMTVDTTARPWKLITDGQSVYFAPAVTEAPVSMIEAGGWIWWTAFGDSDPTNSNDLYAAFCAGNGVSNAHTTTSSQNNGLFYAPSRTMSSTSACMYLARDWNNNVGGAAGACIGHGWDENNCLGYGYLITYPHVTDNGFYLTPLILSQRGAIRAKMPGLYEPLQGRCIENYGIVEDIDGYAGRKFMGLNGICNNGSYVGMLMFDLTGPWR